MCGIAGILGPGSRNAALAEAMAAPLRHRGPDDQGIWQDQEAGVALAHRRLSIVDLSPLGHQPMASSSGRFVLCYNGEIYNHRTIRRALESEKAVPKGGWRGHSDTETLVEAIEHWGVERTLSEAAGMFAFALWDRSKRTLTLARDRFGEKPLYVGQAGRDLVFASELRPIEAHPDFDAAIDRDALAAYAQRGCVPAPRTIYCDVVKLLPGTLATISTESFDLDALRRPPAEIGSGSNYRRYWSYCDTLERGASMPFQTAGEAVTELESALRTAVREQSVADVDVGAFLSGGIDSSTVVALYQAESGRRVRTYTIGFDDPAFDESAHAAAVARHLGTEHHELIVTPDDARAVIPELPTIYDEPFADSSQIPTYIVSRFARRDVTVAITGDGGDEMFAGYNRHVMAPALWGKFARVPFGLRAAAGGMSALLPDAAWTLAGRALGRDGRFGEKMAKGVRVASQSRSIDDLYESFLDEWSGRGNPVVGGRVEPARISMPGSHVGDAARLAYLDAMTYLPDDILTKVDRASMAVSLESRAPMLDRRVAEAAARVPDRMKVAGGKGKQILRDILARHVPRDLFERPKTGFGIPVGDWLKGPLRDWAEHLLDENRLGREGWFDPDIVRREWNDHLAGRRNRTASLWSILMFQAWLDRPR